MSNSREALWYVRGGPKNGGRFGYLHKGRFEIGLNHLPATKNGRVRAMRLRRRALRRLGCHGF